MEGEVAHGGGGWRFFGVHVCSVVWCGIMWYSGVG